MIPKIKRILYATDLTKNSLYAFFYATDMAKKYDAPIVMLHAVEPPLLYFTPGSLETAERAKGEEQEIDLEEMKERLQDFCERMEVHLGYSCGDLVLDILVPVGYPVEEILKAADEKACDAIVLGTHGKGFLKQTLLGSTAASVLKRSRIPVFAIPLPSDETTIGWDSI